MLVADHPVLDLEPACKRFVEFRIAAVLRPDEGFARITSGIELI
jgi:hypothetical protein